MHYNQHPSIVSNTSDSFVPLFNDDGNQTLVKTEKGIFEIIYNGENRPIKFTNLSDSSFIMMRYDYMGRRGGKLYFNSQGTWTSTAKFFYKDYTLIEESTASNDILKEFVWDPTAGQATRPLFLHLPTQSANLFYCHDANKNVTEVIYRSTENGIGAHYEHDTFGNTIATSRNVASTPNIMTDNPFRFSSEYRDDELDLIYYNYRHYNPEIGRWISRDPIEENGGNNLYGMCKNNLINLLDILGLNLDEYLNNDNCKDYQKAQMNYYLEQIEALSSTLNSASSTPNPAITQTLSAFKTSLTIITAEQNYCAGKEFLMVLLGRIESVVISHNYGISSDELRVELIAALGGTPGSQAAANSAVNAMLAFARAVKDMRERKEGGNE